MKPRIVSEQTGQMAVELAALLPVILVVALIVVNVLCYAELCIRFDRIANDAVLTQGVSPAGATDSASGAQAVQTALEAALDSEACRVAVTAERIGLHEGGALINLSAGTTSYKCTLIYSPWFSSLSIAGASFSAPELVHERTLVVDRYRSAIVA